MGCLEIGCSVNNSLEILPLTLACHSHLGHLLLNFGSLYFKQYRSRLVCPKEQSDHHHQVLINVKVQEHLPYQWAPLQVTG